ncbi:hypothetical protein C1X56_32710, partial [Pseudomonas sp. GW101-1A09]
MLSYTTSQQTREIGIRVALGARPRGILTAVLRKAMLLTGIAVAIAVPVALLAARLMQGLLAGVAADDPRTYLSTIAVLGAVALAAAVRPA